MEPFPLRARPENQGIARAQRRAHSALLRGGLIPERDGSIPARDGTIPKRDAELYFQIAGWGVRANRQGPPKRITPVHNVLVAG
jgi:hypothetical protein